MSRGWPVLYPLTQVPISERLNTEGYPEDALASHMTHCLVHSTCASEYKPKWSSMLRKARSHQKTLVHAAACVSCSRRQQQSPKLLESLALPKECQAPST